MKKVLITGARGQVGQALLGEDAALGWEILAPSRADLDLVDAEAVAAYWAVHRPDYCINCAAYTAVDLAESEVEAAFAVNAEALKYLAAQAEIYGTRLVHLSTDYVYHQSTGRPFVETDTTAPRSVYGKSKLAGERYLFDASAEAMIWRTAWVYGTSGHNFLKTMWRLGRQRSALRVVFDQIGSPTYARDLARALWIALAKIEEGLTNWQGIYHYSNEGVCSWYDFACGIFEYGAIPCSVEPIRSEAYPTPAERPPFSVLDKAKVKATFGVEIPHWRASMQHCIDSLITLSDE